MTPRLPDFVLIGAMRSGTTSLHEWLARQPELWLVPTKEPHFFSKHVEWNRGIDAYKAMFALAGDDQLAGESSTSYTDPKWHELAAERMHATVPDARLIYIVRHPIERLRSDLLHEIRQGREARPAREAIADADAPHVLRSCYYTCLEPYLSRFRPDQLLVVRFEDLVATDGDGWEAVLRHLGLAPRPSPGTVHNAGRDAPGAGGLMRWVRSRRWARQLRRIPAPLRAWGKRAAGRASERGAPQAALGALEVPFEVETRIWADVARLESHLRRDRPLWER